VLGSEAAQQQLKALSIKQELKKQPKQHLLHLLKANNR